MIVLARGLSRATGIKIEVDTDALILIFGAIGLVISMVAALTFGLDLTGMLF